MFRGLLARRGALPQNASSKTRQRWYLTGDLVARDADGTYWFIGRADDIIKTAGHMVGPFEVESA